MRAVFLASAVAAAAAVTAAQDAPRFRYRAGDVYVAVEHTLQREVDARTRFALATSHTTERRYTVLAVDDDGSAEVLVEESTGPQQLHEYEVQGRDERAAYRQKGFNPDATARQRVLTATFTPTRFRCEPARDEPAVYYLQQLPELLAHALTLPPDGATAWTVAPPLPLLKANLALRRDGERIGGELQLTIADPRVRKGEPVVCDGGEVEWQFDAATSLPRRWHVALRYPRFPIDRPNVQTTDGELFVGSRLGDVELQQLRADFTAFAAIRDGFFAGRFPQALAAAAAFTTERQDSRLAAAVAAEVEAFRRQVPRWGQEPPALAVEQWFGGEPTTLAALRGKVVVLDFWATWCVPCVAGMEHLIALHEARRGDGLSVLGLTRLDRQQSLDDVRAFHDGGYAKAHDGVAIGYPLVVLQGNALHEWFAIRAIPKLVVLDRDGRVYWEQTGAGGSARLDRIVAAALGKGD